MSSRKIYKFLCFFLITINLLCFSVNGLTAPIELKAQIYYEQGEYQKVIQLLANFQEKNNPVIYEYLAASYQKIGKSSSALMHWYQAQILYLEQQNYHRAAICLIQRAETYIGLGEPQFALAILEEWEYPLPVAANGIRGNAYLLANDYERAITYYQKTLKLDLDSEQLLATYNNLRSSHQKLAKKYLNLAQFVRQKPEKEKLIEKAEREIEKAKETQRIAADLAQKQKSYNAIKTKIDGVELIPSSQKQDHLPEIFDEIKPLSANHQKIKLLISLAKVSPSPQIPLQQALDIAENIEDNFGLSIAAAELGAFYEREQNFKEALKYTHLAEMKIAPFLNYHYLFKWQWQEARIYEGLNQKEEAKSAYFSCLDSIQQIRPEIAVAGRDSEFNFEEEIEPIYRGLLTLLLENPSKKELEKSLDIFESFQVAELENLFLETCFYEEKKKVSQWQTQENIILLFPIVLEHELHIIASLPDGKYYHSAHSINKRELKDKIEQWGKELEASHRQNYLKTGALFYQLIFKPFEQEIKEVAPNLIVFVNDGLFRNVPMSALFDPESKQFLIEKYPLALALGRNFLHLTTAKEFNFLGFGLSQPRPPINAPLPKAEEEIKSIEALLGGRGFVDEQFTKESVRKQIQENHPTVLHFATHGEFTGLIENSFIQAYDQIITSESLEELLTLSDINLLILSACETSAGNNRSVLGLAGIAIRSGVPSVLGTLWPVGDNASLVIISEFYRNWKGGMSKAKALQQAQLNSIKQKAHPSNWSSFILIGN